MSRDERPMPTPVPAVPQRPCSVPSRPNDRLVRRERTAWTADRQCFVLLSLLCRTRAVTGASCGIRAGHLFALCMSICGAARAGRGLWRGSRQAPKRGACPASWILALPVPEHVAILAHSTKRATPSLTLLRTRSSMSRSRFLQQLMRSGATCIEKVTEAVRAPPLFPRTPPVCHHNVSALHYGNQARVRVRGRFTQLD